MTALKLPENIHPIPGQVEADGTQYEVANGMVQVTNPTHIALLKARGFTDAHPPAKPAPLPHKTAAQTAADKAAADKAAAEARANKPTVPHRRPR